MSALYRRLLAISLLLALGARPAQAAELSVDGYARLTLELLDLSAAAWRAKVEAAGRLAPGSSALVAEHQRIDADAARQAADARHRQGISRDDYDRFRSRNSEAVEARLAADPDLRAAIERRRVEIEALIAEIERLGADKR